MIIVMCKNCLDVISPTDVSYKECDCGNVKAKVTKDGVVYKGDWAIPIQIGINDVLRFSSNFSFILSEGQAIRVKKIDFVKNCSGLCKVG